MFTFSGRISASREASDAVSIADAIACSPLVEAIGAADESLAGGRKLTEKVNKAGKTMRKQHELYDRFAKDFDLIVEAGYVAIKQLDRESAEKLFCAARLLNPHHTAPIMGEGYLALYSMDLINAQKRFEEVLKLEPQNLNAKVLIGFCGIMTKVGYDAEKDKTVEQKKIDETAVQGAKLVKEAVEASNSPELKQFGMSALELLDKLDSFKSPLKR